MKRIAFACALAYTAAHFFVSGIRQPLRNFQGDFLASFPSWRLSVLLGRLDLFHGSLAEKWAHGSLWHYGPVEHLVTLPLFAFRDLGPAYVAWLFVNEVFLAAILVIAAKIFFPSERRWVALSICAIVMFNFNPLYEGLAQRVIEIFELLLIVIAFVLMRRDRQFASGFVIGVASMTKFLPLIFLPYFIVKRNWRALAGSLTAILPIAIVTQIVFGWEHSGILLQLRDLGIAGHFGDQGISGMALRLLRWSHAPLPPLLVSRTVIAAGLLALCWLFFHVRHCRGAEEMEWSTLLVAMVMLAPRTENYYLLFFVFPYLALVARRRDPWWLAVSYLIAGVVIPLSIVSHIAGFDVFSRYLTLGIPFVGAAILAVLCVRALLDECRHTVCSLSG